MTSSYVDVNSPWAFHLQVLVNGAKVLPHKEVKDDVETPQIIL